jgi:hypothetical protein
MAHVHLNHDPSREELPSPRLLQHKQRKLKYFVIDCRRHRSSEDFKSGHVPASFRLDPSVLDDPDRMEAALQTLVPLRAKVHMVLLGHGVMMMEALALPSGDDVTHTRDMPAATAALRDHIREDVLVLNRAVLWLQKHGFVYVSVIENGFAAWHAALVQNPSLLDEHLIYHEPKGCRYCRRRGDIENTTKDPDNVVAHRSFDIGTVHVNAPPRMMMMTLMMIDPLEMMPHAKQKLTAAVSVLHQASMSLKERATLLKEHVSSSPHFGTVAENTRSTERTYRMSPNSCRRSRSHSQQPSSSSSSVPFWTNVKSGGGSGIPWPSMRHRHRHRQTSRASCDAADASSLGCSITTVCVEENDLEKEREGHLARQPHGVFSDDEEIEIPLPVMTA